MLTIRNGMLVNFTIIFILSKNKMFVTDKFTYNLYFYKLCIILHLSWYIIYYINQGIGYYSMYITHYNVASR